MGWGVTATGGFGGRVAVTGPESVSMLRLSDGTRVCRKRYDERIFVGDPVFDPASGGIYTFDIEANDLYKVGPDCLEDWSYPLGADLVGLVATKTNVVGTAGTTVFALVP